MRHPEVDLRRGRVAVYGRLVSPDGVLRDRDRVEILRPLNADPKEYAGGVPPSVGYVAERAICTSCQPPSWR